MAYQIVKEFIKRFKERYGSTTCRELMGCNVSDPSQAQQAREKDLFISTCSPMIWESVIILEGLLPPAETGRHIP